MIFLMADLGGFDEVKWIEDELPSTVDASKEWIEYCLFTKRLTTSYVRSVWELLISIGLLCFLFALPLLVQQQLTEEVIVDASRIY